MAATRILLVDNGSLQPAATLALRRLSAEVAQLLGHPVYPVSVLHSHKLDPTLLEGTPAVIFEQSVQQAKADGIAELIVLPLFIGPSLALTEYLPKVFAEANPGAMKLAIRPTLFGDNGAELLAMLVDHLRQAGGDIEHDLILLCDHGSPLKAVTACRDALARDLAKELSFAPSRLVACSMERREGPAYAFNEPLLATALTLAKGDVIILMLFLLPGRHAGPDGDVATIASAHGPAGTHVRLSPLLASHPRMSELLAQRSGLPYGKKPPRGSLPWVKFGTWLVVLALAGWGLGAIGWWVFRR